MLIICVISEAWLCVCVKVCVFLCFRLWRSFITVSNDWRSGCVLVFLVYWTVQFEALHVPDDGGGMKRLLKLTDCRLSMNIRLTTFHFCFAKCFLIFAVTCPAKSFVDAMPPEILNRLSFLNSIASSVKRGKGMKTQSITRDDPVTLRTYTALTDTSPLNDWWSLLLNILVMKPTGSP